VFFGWADIFRAMAQEENKIDVLAKIIWDYHHMNNAVRKSDAILVLGSHDIRVAQRGAELYLQGLAPNLIFSGGIGRLSKGVFKKPEADLFAETAVKMGVPEKALIVENKSTNTGENIEFTKKLLREKGLDFNSFILVQKPYMERRAYATFKKVWPEKKFVVTSPQQSFEKYTSSTEIPKDEVINIMVGDLQRIKEYPKLGFQIKQDIPAEAWESYNHLVSLGYTKHLIK